MMVNDRKRVSSIIGFLPVLGFLIAWEGITRLGIVPQQMLPPFSRVMTEAYDLIKSGVLLRNFSMSLMRVLIGFITGSIAGLLFGLLMGWKEVAQKTFSPIVSFLYPIPALGWLPIFMIWFGINELLPIAIIFTCSFFPILYNTASGVREVDRNYVQVARTLGYGEGRILLSILFPLALPSIFTGLRLEAGMAWRVIIAAEMVAIPTGIGALLMRAESLIRMDIIIVCLMVLAIMCFSFERVFYFLERRITDRWRLG
jgi:NitT/TauT family transport system permease protein